MRRQQCVQLFSLTWDIVGRWKGYFEDLLYPTVTTSFEEAEARDPEADSSFKLKSLRYFWGLALGVCTGNWGGDATIQKGGLNGLFQLLGMTLLWVGIRSHCISLLQMMLSSGSSQRQRSLRFLFMSVGNREPDRRFMGLTGSVTFYFHSHMLYQFASVMKELN